MKANGPEDLVRRATQLTTELKATHKELDELNARIASQKIEGLFDDAKVVRGVRVVAMAFTGTGADAIRTMCERCRDVAKKNAVVVLAGIQEDAESVTFGCVCAPEAIKAGAHAGNIVREVAKICGGKGGGRPDIAMGGGKDLHSVDDALNAVDDILEKLLPEQA